MMGRWRALETLFAKFVAILVPVMVTAALAAAALLMVNRHHTLSRELVEDARASMESHAGALGELLWTVDEENVRRLMKALGSGRDIACVEVTDSYSDIKYAWPQADCLAAFPEASMLARTLSFKERSIGRLAIGYTSDRIQTQLWRSALGDLALMAILVAAGLGTALLAYRATISRPLGRLMQAIETTGTEGGSRVVQWSSHDELGRVIEAFNRMSDQVERRGLALTAEKAEAERALAQLNEAHAELNKVTASINESIRYASRIQNSLLPDVAGLDGLVDDLAVIWRPRDVVGGDFYWCGRFGSRCVIAIMDCTGHGVPGAFMSAVVASILDRILHDYCHDDPARVLGMLNRMVKASLRQNAGGAGSDDGLDAAICLIDQERNVLTFAGSNIPLAVLRNGVLDHIWGDRHSLGYRRSKADFTFTNHDIRLEPGLAFFLYTDGVVDLAGGPRKVLFGRKRMAEVLERADGLPMVECLRLLDQAAEGWMGDERPRDDLTVIGFVPQSLSGGTLRLAGE